MPAVPGGVADHGLHRCCPRNRAGGHRATGTHDISLQRSGPPWSQLPHHCKCPRSSPLCPTTGRGLLKDPTSIWQGHVSTNLVDSCCTEDAGPEPRVVPGEAGNHVGVGASSQNSASALCLICVFLLQASKRLICSGKQTSKQDFVSESLHLIQQSCLRPPRAFIATSQVDERDGSQERGAGEGRRGGAQTPTAVPRTLVLFLQLRRGRVDQNQCAGGQLPSPLIPRLLPYRSPGSPPDTSKTLPIACQPVLKDAPAKVLLDRHAFPRSACWLPIKPPASSEWLLHSAQTRNWVPFESSVPLALAAGHPAAEPAPQKPLIHVITWGPVQMHHRLMGGEGSTDSLRGGVRPTFWRNQAVKSRAP